MSPLPLCLALYTYQRAEEGVYTLFDRYDLSKTDLTSKAKNELAY